MTENLRYDDTYDHEAGFDPALNWDNENGFQGMVELCHGDPTMYEAYPPDTVGRERSIEDSVK